MKVVGSVACLYLLASVAYGLDGYVGIPKAMSMLNFTEFVVGRWHNETFRVISGETVPADLVGQSIRVLKEDNTFHVHLTSGYKIPDEPITCVDEQFSMVQKKYQAAVFDVNDCSKDADRTIIIAPEYAYVNFFSRDPSMYFVVLRCFVHPTNQGCPMDKMTMNVHTTWNAEVGNMIWEDLGMLGISEETPGVSIHDFDADGSIGTYEACTSEAL